MCIDLLTITFRLNTVWSGIYSLHKFKVLVIFLLDLSTHNYVLRFRGLLRFRAMSGPYFTYILCLNTIWHVLFRIPSCFVILPLDLSIHNYILRFRGVLRFWGLLDLFVYEIASKTFSISGNNRLIITTDTCF